MTTLSPNKLTHVGYSYDQERSQDAPSSDSIRPFGLSFVQSVPPLDGSTIPVTNLDPDEQVSYVENGDKLITYHTINDESYARTDSEHDSQVFTDWSIVD